MKKASEILEIISTARKDLEFMSTGFSQIDEILDGGFMKKELIIVGGSTGIGKSYIAGQIQNTIATQGYSTAYFSLEISNEMVLSRMLGQMSNIKSTHIITGKAANESYEQARVKIIANEPFMDFYDDIYNYEQISKTIRANKYEFVVIDFIQNIIIQGMDEYPKLSFIALDLQKLAKETGCTILLLSQLSNSVSRDKDDPRLEYKGSGSIATVADIGFFIIRNELDKNKLTLLLRKNRRGLSGISFDYHFKDPGGMIS